MKPSKVQKLEARVRELEQHLACRCKSHPCSCYCPPGLPKALATAIKTRAHGHVMTSEGYPVRILCSDVRGCRRNYVLAGLMQYPMGHELPEMWTKDGYHTSPRGRLCLVPLDKKHLNEGFYRYGMAVLKALGLDS